jgi:hypothetical protein
VNTGVLNNGGNEMKKILGTIVVSIVLFAGAMVQAQSVTPKSFAFCTDGTGTTCNSWATLQGEADLTYGGTCGTDCVYYTLDNYSSYSNAHGVKITCAWAEGNGYSIHNTSDQYYDFVNSPYGWEEMETHYTMFVPNFGGQEVSVLDNQYAEFDYSSGDVVARCEATFNKPIGGGLYLWKFMYVQIRI